MASEYICETSTQTVFGKQACGRGATHVYGPECEAQTGQLMYLCPLHAAQVAGWIATHQNEPVECPTHGIIGKVKDYLILKET